MGNFIAGTLVFLFISLVFIWIVDAILVGTNKRRESIWDTHTKSVSTAVVLITLIGGGSFAHNKNNAQAYVPMFYDEPESTQYNEDYYNYAIAGLLPIEGTDSPTTSRRKKEEKVFVCTGPQSKRYHKRSDCRGLQSCSKSIIRVTKSEAKEMGRTPCGYCY